MATQIKLRRDTDTNWTANSTVVLAQGEIGVNLTNGQFKLGNGTSTWAQLTYFAPGASGVSISDFGEGFTDSLDAGKITTSKLYNENPNPALNNQYTLEVTNGGVVALPDGSIINGATLKTVPGNYAGITAGPASPAGKDEDSWVWVDNDGATISTKYSTSNFQWKFDNNGATTFPTLTVPISDNTTPNGTGQTIKFSDSSQQAIIFGPAAEDLHAERVIIQGAPGFTGTAGEGGDVYLWGGPGGSLNGGGGDIKVRGGLGNGTGSGGYLNFQAGNTSTGNGGYINIESGYSSTYGSGGDITVQANAGGEITLLTYSSTGFGNLWVLGNDGVLSLPNSGTINDYVGSAGVLGIYIDRVFQTPDNTNSANFGTDTVKLLLSDVEAAEIVSYLTASIGVKVWFNQGNSYPITSCVQVSTGIWTVTATGMGNTFATFAAINTLIYIYTGATPNNYQDFPQYVPVGDGAGITVSKGGNSWNFGTDGVLTLPNGLTIDASDSIPTVKIGGENTQIRIDDGGAPPGLYIRTDMTGADHGWLFDPDGALSYPNNALQRDTGTVTCLGNASTVVYTASGQYQNTIKLLIQVEGYVGAPVSWDTQACEMIIAKSFRANDIASTVYGIVHTSVAPLATFTAEWNALTNRVQVLCATPSANSVYVKTFATEIYTAD